MLHFRDNIHTANERLIMNYLSFSKSGNQSASPRGVALHKIKKLIALAFVAALTLSTASFAQDNMQADKMKKAKMSSSKMNDGNMKDHKMPDGKMMDDKMSGKKMPKDKMKKEKMKPANP